MSIANGRGQDQISGIDMAMEVMQKFCHCFSQNCTYKEKSVGSVPKQFMKYIQRFNIVNYCTAIVYF